MPSLQSDLADRFRNKLTRSSVVSASRWASQYRIMGGEEAGPWSFDKRPWLKEMHDTKAEENIGQKAAQMGYSETMMNTAFYNLDIKRRNVLYILPNQRPDAADFTNRAFNPAIDDSPHLKSMFTDINNVGHKMVGNASLYIRGSNARSALKSVPASVLIFDEFDEMQVKNIKLAEARSDGQAEKLDWKVSTPTVPNRGINTLFNRSTKEHFHFKCPGCSQLIQLIFPDNLVITTDDPDDPKIMNSHLICNHCKCVLQHEDKIRFLKTGRWVADQPDKVLRGFHINQLYSPAQKPWKIAKLYLESKKDPFAETEFFNSKLGLPHIIEGAQITEEMFERLIKGNQMVQGARPNLITTMGIDVGTQCHVEIDMWDLTDSNPQDINTNARCKVLWAGAVEKDQLRSFVADAMASYNLNFAVIDAMPETLLSQQICNDHYGKMRMCRYNSHQTARSVFASDKDIQVSVNRTSWLDMSLGRFRNGSIFLPCNLPREYTAHIMGPIRKPEQDSNGQLVYKYVTQDHVADHFAHARNYAEIALLFATGSIVYQTIRERV